MDQPGLVPQNGAESPCGGADCLLSKVRGPLWLRAALLAGAYHLLAWAGTLLRPADVPFLTLWLPAGLFLSALLVSPRRQWPVLTGAAIAANLAFNLLQGNSLPVSLCFSAANAAAALASAATIVRLIGRGSICSSVRQMVKFLCLALVVGPSVAASVATLGLVLSSSAPLSGWTWALWWTRDALGVLLVSPLLLCECVVPGPDEWARPPRRLEAAVLAVLLAAGPVVAFHQGLHPQLAFKYTLFPLLMWAGLRLGCRGASAGAMLVAVVAIWLTLRGHSEFSRMTAPLSRQVLALHAYLLVLGLSGLLPAALMTERKRAENDLRLSESRLRRLYDSIQAGIILQRADGRLVHVNQVAADIFGMTVAQAQAKTSVDPDWCMVDQAGHRVPGEDHPSMVTLRTGQPIRNAVRGLFADDPQRMRWLLINTEPGIDPASGKVAEVLVTFLDITKLKHAQDALHDRERDLVRTFDQSPLGTAVVSLEGRFLRVNEALCRVTGYSADELLHLGFPDITHRDDRESSMDLVNRLLQGQTDNADMDKRYVRKDGSFVWGHVTVRLMRGDDGRPLYFLPMIEDITLRKRMDDELRRSLAEKEVLLREVHHRVKNNLAAVISLLALQGEALAGPHERMVLNELGGRIRAMSLVHEKLYRSESLARIDFGEYLQSLVSHLRTSFAPRTSLRVTVDARVAVSLDIAIPCGMIVNELVTNALKYAFPQGRPGPGQDQCELAVCMEMLGPRYRLSVRDNGVGLPQGLDWTTTPSLGLRLVRMLGQHQLGGTVEVDRSAGTQVVLSFEAARWGQA